MDGKPTVAEMKLIWGFKKQEDGTLVITGYKGTDTEIEIPETIGKNTVTAIGIRAFSVKGGYKSKDAVNVLNKITKITLPNTITRIEEKAFYGDEKLTEINIPEGVVEIGDYAFQGCGFKTLVLPESVREIGYGAFGLCCNLEKATFRNGITEIPKNAFNCCVNLSSVEIADSVRIIERDAFNSCRNLENVVIPNGVEEIERNAFAQCWGLKTIVIPQSVYAMGVEEEGGSANTIFLGCKNVTAIVEPNSYAERYCERLEIPYKYAE